MPSVEQWYTDLVHRSDQYTLRELGEMSKGTMVSAFAVITDTKTIKQTNGRSQQWYQTILITDPTVTEGSVINIGFHQNRESLPKNEPGRILVLKHAFVDFFNGHCQLVARGSGNALQPTRTVYVTLNMETLEKYPSEDVDCQLSKSDMKVIKALRKWYRASDNQNDTTTTAAANTSIASMPVSTDARVKTAKRSNRPLLTTEALASHPAFYFDYVGMVVKYIPNEERHRVDLVLTDFTQNQYPIGQNVALYDIDPSLLLQCTLWDNHADRCPSLELGNYIYLSNCTRNKKRQDGLEIHVKGNRDTKQHVNILQPDQNILEALLQRQQHYFADFPISREAKSEKRKKFTTTTTTNTKTGTTHKRTNDIDHSVDDESSGSSSNNPALKKMKMDRLYHASGSVDDDNEEPVVDTYMKETFPLKTVTDLNVNTHTSFEDLILFESEENIPVEFLTKAIIKNVEPTDIRQWVKTLCQKCNQIYELLDEKCDHEEAELVYQFELLLEEHETGRNLTLRCFGEEAEQFFPEVRPADILLDFTALGQVEKMIRLACSDDVGVLEFGITAFRKAGKPLFYITGTQLISSK